MRQNVRTVRIVRSRSNHSGRSNRSGRSDRSNGALALLTIAATNASAFSFTPHTVPLQQLLLVSAFGTVLVLFWSSFLVLLTAIVGQGWAFAVTFIAMRLGSSPGMYG